MQPCQESPSLQNLAGSRAEPLSLHEEEPAGREMLRERARVWDWSYSFKKNHPKIQPIPKISPCLKKYMRGSRKLHGGMRGGNSAGSLPAARGRGGGGVGISGCAPRPCSARLRLRCRWRYFKVERGKKTPEASGRLRSRPAVLPSRCL